MITFAIPTYTRLATLQRCVESIMRETLIARVPCKVFVYDDASTDGTPIYLQRMAEGHPGTFSYRRGETNLGFDYSFRETFLAPTTKWLWMMGDDDILTGVGLQQVMELLEQGCPFIHVAEEKRCTGEKGVWTEPTLLGLCSKLGFLEMAGFMSGNVCLAEPLQEVMRSERYRVYAKSAFPHALSILDAFHDQPAAFFNAPIIATQRDAQTEEDLARWKQHRVLMRYNRVVEGLLLLVKDGKIPAKLPEEFFRYHQGELIGKNLWTFWAEACNCDTMVDDEEWDLLHKTIDMIEGDQTWRHSCVVQLHSILIEFLAEIKKLRRLEVRVNEIFNDGNLTPYPKGYL